MLVVIITKFWTFQQFLLCPCVIKSLTTKIRRRMAMAIYVWELSIPKSSEIIKKPIKKAKNWKRSKTDGFYDLGLSRPLNVSSCECCFSKLSRDFQVCWRRKIENKISASLRTLNSAQQRAKLESDAHQLSAFLMETLLLSPAQRSDWRRNHMNKTSRNVNLMNNINKKATK